MISCMVKGKEEKFNDYCHIIYIVICVGHN